MYYIEIVDKKDKVKNSSPSTIYVPIFLQHPFIRNAADPKPIFDLLTEFKAEIVDEKIEDLDDTEVSSLFL